MTDLPTVPQAPPLEVVKQGRLWVLETFQLGTRDGETFSTHDEQIDAVRAAKTKMEDGPYPCTLQWDTPRSVGNLYWNPLYERLEVRYDELLEVWTVVPERGTVGIATCQSRQDACERAEQIQREYHFKHLRAFDAKADQFETRDHWFLRNDITRSGVRFDSDAVDRSDPEPAAPDDTETTEGSARSYDGPATPGQLGASIPDVTQVEFVDTDGSLHRYATPWGDGTRAEILALSRKYSGDPEARRAFETWLSWWERGADPAVAPIHESGIEPAPWVAYQVSEHTLSSLRDEIPVDGRIAVLEQVAGGTTELASVASEPVCGLHPERMYVSPAGTDWRVTVPVWGLEWGVQQATGTHSVSAFTAPEQLGGEVYETTAVYQLGGIAYWLLCESRPVRGDDTAAAIRAGEIDPPEPVSSIARGVGPVIERALATDPGDRYGSATQFVRALHNKL